MSRCDHVMLCRALLAALAVSCTLSIHGHTQRLDRIKDLMCLLLLSGIQKEDLDASMLNKLQRYNVNIHDLNNNELLQECTKLQFLNNNNNKTPETRGIENELETFIPERKVQGIANSNNFKNINEKEYNHSSKNAFEKENYKNDHAIQYMDGKPELQSIMKFWKNVMSNDSNKTTETPIKLGAVNEDISDVRQQQTNKRNTEDASYANKSDTIKKFLLNFLLKSQNNNIDKATTKKTRNFEDLYSSLNFFNKVSDKQYLEINESEKSTNIFPISLEATKIKQYSLDNDLRKNKVQFKTPNRDTERENARSINSNNFNDIINVLQSFKTYYPIIPKDKSIENVNLNNKDRIISSEKIFNFNKIGEHENILTTEKIPEHKIAEQSLSQNVIKEIAKTVKELVLKDLRKEIYTTSYPTTTNILKYIPTTTKRGPIISTNKRENQNAEGSILKKFIDLFEEIKTLNHKRLIISSEIRKESATKEGLTYPIIPPQIFNDMKQPSYKIKQYTDTFSQKTYDFSPQEHKFRSHVVPESILHVPVKSTLPITVQTNNMEIPPIGIPIDTPENPINQNIIVSTMKPYRIGGYKFAQNRIKFPNARIGEEYEPKQQIRFGKVKGPTNYYTNHKNDKSLLPNKDHSNTNFNNKAILNRYEKSDHRGDELKHSDIPRFHEQLERGMNYFDTPQKDYIDREDCCDERHAYSKQMADCCDRKIASRQQMSLNNVKRQPSYDDTHFRNFLKSQQKVTDMLERILASRNRVRSVETA